MGGRRAHRLDLSVPRVEFFQCAAPDKVGAVPNAPERYVRGPERVDVHRVDALRRRDRAHLGDVFGQQGLDLRAGQVIDHDSHVRNSWSGLPAASEA